MVRVDSAPQNKHIDRMLRGIVIDTTLVAPIEVSVLRSGGGAGPVKHWIRVVVAEGKKHEVGAHFCTTCSVATACAAQLALALSHQYLIKGMHHLLG